MCGSSVMMVCVLLLLFYMIKKGITLCCFESVVVLLLLKKKIFKRKVNGVCVKFLTFPFFLRIFSFSHVQWKNFFFCRTISSVARKNWKFLPCTEKVDDIILPYDVKNGHSSCLFGPCKSSHFIGNF